MSTATLARHQAETTTTAEDNPDLDALHAMPFADLETRYRRAPPPPSRIWTASRGAACWPCAAPPTAHWPGPRAFARSGVFPWYGNNFTSHDGKAGEGINRINLLRLYNPTWFRFETSFAPSLIDDRRCLRLNYNLPGNPPGIRHIVDELREVAPDVYLGPAQLVIGTRQPRTVLYFGISHQ